MPSLNNLPIRFRTITVHTSVPLAVTIWAALATGRTEVVDCLLRRGLEAQTMDPEVEEERCQLVHFKILPFMTHVSIYTIDHCCGARQLNSLLL